MASQLNGPAPERTDDPISVLRKNAKFPTVRFTELLDIFEAHKKQVAEMAQCSIPKGRCLYVFQGCLNAPFYGSRGQAMAFGSSKQEAIETLIKEFETIRYFGQLRKEFFEELEKSFSEEIVRNNNVRSVGDMSQAVGVDTAFGIYKLFPEFNSFMGDWEGTSADFRRELYSCPVSVISPNSHFALFSGGVNSD